MFDVVKRFNLEIKSCFDLFKVFSGAMCEASIRLGKKVSDDVESKVWLGLCNENRDMHYEQHRGSASVKKSRPVAVRELSLVKSCKRKVRW